MRNLGLDFTATLIRMIADNRMSPRWDEIPLPKGRLPLKHGTEAQPCSTDTTCPAHILPPSRCRLCVGQNPLTPSIGRSLRSCRDAFNEMQNQIIHTPAPAPYPIYQST